MLPEPRPGRLSHMAAVLVAVLATSCLTVEAKLPWQIMLDGATFSMKSELISMFEHLHIEEFHSAHQQRSRVNYRIEPIRGLPAGFLGSQGSFLADNLGAYEISQDNCRPVQHKAIGKALNIDMFDGADGASESHVIGAARLLLAIQRNSQLFEPALVDGVASADTYEAELGKYKVTVFYEGAHCMALGVPSVVRVSEKTSFFVIRIKPKMVTLLRPNEMIFVGSSLPSARQPNTDNELLYDVLALERARECTKDSSTNRISVLKDNYRFSFKARLISKAEAPVHLVVGYEPELATLRVDRSHEDAWSHTITNYKQGRRYNVVRRVTGGGGGGGDGQQGARGNVLDVRQQNDVSCVVTRAVLAQNATSYEENLPSLGFMLLGVSQVTYLGMARVRGIDAYAYEAYDSKLPVWLDAPSVFETPKGELERRAGPWPKDRLVRKLTTVLYFSQKLSAEDKSVADKKLILIEVFKRLFYSHTVLLYTIPVYEFSWDLRPTAPNGERTEDFFSLADECLAPSTGDNHYARVSLQLQPAGQYDDASPDLVDPVGGFPQWVREPTKRNLALIRAIGEQFSLPITLIYDLQSHRTTAGKSSMGPSALAVTMFTAERKKTPVALKYLGRTSEPLQGFDKRPVISFQGCYELAAHRHRDTQFVYYDDNSICFIPLKDMADNSKGGANIILDPLRSFEVYQTVHRTEVELDQEDYVTGLEETRNRITEKSRLALVDPGQVYYGHERDTRAPLYFKMINFELEHLNEKVSYDLDDHHLADINKFPGLGLIADDPQNMLIESKQGVSDGDMTFERCQEVCLIDAECEAYSTCIVDGRVQCILSSVDFRVPTTVIELMLLRDKKSRLGEIFEVKLSGGETQEGAQVVDSSSVHIRKHQTCELHNKLYRHVFKPAGLALVPLKDRLLRPVSHSEQCAEFCFLGTLATMRKEARRMHKTVRDKHDPGLTEGYSASHCGHYFYLDRQKLERSQAKIPAEQIIGMNTDGATRGYCVFDDESTSDTEPLVAPKGEKGKKSKSSESSLIFELRKFELDFSVLYEKKHGVSLVKSTKSPEEELAYGKLLANQDYTSEQLDLMRKFAQAGGNTAQMGWAVDAQLCARTCFTQLASLWPACRSFEYIEYTFTRTAAKMAACVYNSMTVGELRNLGKNELVRDNNTQDQFEALPGDEIQVWHYEPRYGLVATSIDQHYQVSADQSGLRLDNLSTHLQISTLGFVLTICIVMTVGFAFGTIISSSQWIESIMSGTGIANGHAFQGDTATLVDDAGGLL